MLINRRKKIKFKNVNYNIGVYTYCNGRLRLRLENNKEAHDITFDLKDCYVQKEDILLDPVVTQNGLLKILKKNRIIRRIKGLTNYGYVAIPIAQVNMGILKQYDYDGVMKHLDEISKGGFNG